MNPFGELIARYRRFQERARERREFLVAHQVISQLPQHIRKDIGWPTAHDRQRGPWS